MPMMVNGILLIVTCLPITDEFEANRDSQYWWLNIATGGAVGLSSVSVIVRPSSGGTPKAGLELVFA